MTALLITLIALVILLFITEVNVKRQRDELRFDIMFLNLETIIEKWPVNKTSYLKICSYFEDIKKCRWKNTEKVTVLYMAFLEKYERASFILDSLEEPDEFSPESVFRK